MHFTLQECILLRKSACVVSYFINVLQKFILQSLTHVVQSLGTSLIFVLQFQSDQIIVSFVGNSSYIIKFFNVLLHPSFNFCKTLSNFIHLLSWSSHWYFSFSGWFFRVFFFFTNRFCFWNLSLILILISIVSFRLVSFNFLIYNFLVACAYRPFGLVITGVFLCFCSLNLWVNAFF